MTEDQLRAIITGSLPIKFQMADGTVLTVAQIDRVLGTTGLYPTSEPDVAAFVLIKFGA